MNYSSSSVSTRLPGGNSASTRLDSRISFDVKMPSPADGHDAQQFKLCLQDSEQGQSLEDDVREQSTTESLEAAETGKQTRSTPDNTLIKQVPLAETEDPILEHELLDKGRADHNETVGCGVLALFGQSELHMSTTVLEASTVDHAAPAPAVNAAVAAIMHEFQQRVRRSEERHWQFSLQGVFDQPITIELECLEGDHWHVRVDAHDASDDDVFQLLSQLKTRLSSVANSTLEVL